MTYPIVLAHGVCRFDAVWSEALGLDNRDDADTDLLHYFKGIRTMLIKKGYPVFHSKVPWGARVDVRAEALRSNIQQVLGDTGAAKVNIIAHSMGGLDTRHMMFNDRNQGKIHENIASLTTLSTPHWGSPFADWGIGHFNYLISVAKQIGLDLEALKDLTVAACTEYNETAEVAAFEQTCAQQIRFQTYAGRQKFWGVFDALKLPFYIIEQIEGPNDGLVSVQSAKWQERFFKGIIEDADHINELGWWDTAQIWAKESEADLLRRIHGVYADIAAGLP
jgi:triacylglycerol lipase